MVRRERASVERESWRLAALQLDACRAGAKELERIIEDAQAAARGAVAFTDALTDSHG